MIATAAAQPGQQQAQQQNKAAAAAVQQLNYAIPSGAGNQFIIASQLPMGIQQLNNAAVSSQASPATLQQATLQQPQQQIQQKPQELQQKVSLIINTPQAYILLLAVASFNVFILYS